MIDIFSQTPLVDMSESILTMVRITIGVIMIYYGSTKIRDTRTNYSNFDHMGFHPGWLWGSIVMILEFFGGIMLILGIFPAQIVLLFGIQMLVGTIWKITKTNKPFTDWSYDVLLLGLCLIILAFGPGNLLLIG
tara:strand:- start:57 stop:458 length:402 start_codon:yes stop_codon:yes gene_type:complete